MHRFIYVLTTQHGVMEKQAVSKSLYYLFIYSFWFAKGRLGRIVLVVANVARSL